MTSFKIAKECQLMSKLHEFYIKYVHIQYYNVRI